MFIGDQYLTQPSVQRADYSPHLLIAIRDQNRELYPANLNEVDAESSVVKLTITNIAVDIEITATHVRHRTHIAEPLQIALRDEALHKVRRVGSRPTDSDYGAIK